MSTLKRKKCLYFSLVKPNELTRVKIEVKRPQAHKKVWTGSDQRALHARGGSHKRGEQ